MGYPGSLNKAVVVHETSPATPSVSGAFFNKITVAGAGNLYVTGIGIFKFIGSGSSGSGYIDPTTGEEFDGNVSSNGYYEALPSTRVTIACVANQVLEGVFSSVQKVTASSEATGVMAYE
jgi:hypothetical protein